MGLSVVWRALARLMLAASVVAALAIPVALAASEGAFYLRSTGVPSALMGTNPPSGALGNHDPGRNSDPGLTLVPTSNGSAESEASRFQQWAWPGVGVDIDGPASLTITAAMDDLSSEANGRLAAYLMECSGLNDCTVVASGAVSASPWSADGDWEQRTISFGTVTHEFASSSRLTVKVVVDAAVAEADMWLAYDAGDYQSNFSYEEGSSTTTTTTTTSSSTTTTTSPTTTTTLAPTTTTTTTTTVPTTTSTTAPPQTTTTTAPATTTTTAETTTTTNADNGGAGTTTTTDASSSGAPGTATTTTAVPGLSIGTQPEPADLALPVLPDPQDDPGVRAGGLLRAVDFVLPDRAAQIVVSPLVVLGAMIDAMFLTGREVSVPAALTGALSGVLIAVSPFRRRKASP